MNAFLNVERWLPFIIKVLFPDNSFGARVNSLDAFVNAQTANAKVVNIPREAIKPTVVKNTSYPKAVANIDDENVAMTVDCYDTLGTRVTENYDQLFLSYDKQQSLLMRHAEAIKEVIHNEMLQAFVANMVVDSGSVALPIAQFVPTTGTVVASFKQLTYADFLAAVTKLNKANMPQSGRVAVVDADLHGQMMAIENFIQADKLGYSNIPEGLIGRVLGVDIYIRSWTPRYDQTAYVANTTPPTLQPIGSGTSASIVLFHTDYVHRGVGQLRMDVEQRRVTEGGTLVDAKMVGGFTRSKNEAVVVIFQDDNV